MTDADAAVVLHVHPPRWGLAASHPASLALLAHCALLPLATTRRTTAAAASPTNALPFVQTGRRTLAESSQKKKKKKRKKKEKKRKKKEKDSFSLIVHAECAGQARWRAALSELVPPLPAQPALLALIESQIGAAQLFQACAGASNAHACRWRAGEGRREGGGGG